MEIKGTVESIPVKKRSPRVGVMHPDVLNMIEDLKTADAGQILEYGFAGETSDTIKDARLAGVRAVALRRAGYNATTRGTSVFVTV